MRKKLDPLNFKQKKPPVCPLAIYPLQSVVTYLVTITLGLNLVSTTISRNRKYRLKHNLCILMNIFTTMTVRIISHKYIQETLVVTITVTRSPPVLKANFWQFIENETG